jgi:hypothetical protein
MTGYRRPRHASLKALAIVAGVIMIPWAVWAYWPYIAGWFK